MFETMTRLFPVVVGRRPNLLTRIRSARALTRSRKALATLTAHQLADIGISEADARREADRSAWDAPSNWTG